MTRGRSSTRPVWEESGWSGYPPLTSDATADVCVVGLGGSGLAAVAWLLEQGLDVVGVDAGSVAGGAAGRNGGFLLAGVADFHHVAAEHIGSRHAAALYRATLEEMDRMESATPDAIRRRGSLRIADSEEELRDCEAQLVAMTSASLPVESYEGPEGRGLRFPRDGSLQPLRRCRALADRWASAGARLHERSPVAELADGRVTLADGVRVRCGHVVVAVDGNLERLLPETAGRVRTARVQVLATAPTREVALPMPVYARYGYDFWQQLPDGRIVLGGARDRGGDDEWTGTTEPSAVVQDALERVLRERIGVTAPVERRWAGAIAFSDGVLPLLDEVRPGVVAAGGYRGTGNVVGALWGRAAAQLSVTGAVHEPAVAAATGLG